MAQWIGFCDVEAWLKVYDIDIVLFTPSLVHAFLNINPSFNSWLIIMKTFIICLQIMPCKEMGQSHCAKDELGPWMVHTWVLLPTDNTNATSSAFEYKYT